MKKLLLFFGIVAMSLSAWAGNVHLDPKLTNALNPTGGASLWTQYSGTMNEYLYPNNTEVKINSTAFDNYARFSFYRSNSVTSIEPNYFNNFANSGLIPSTIMWDSLSGDNKRQTLYARGDLQFLQNNENYVCNGISFFTTSSYYYVPKNSRFENVYHDWMATNYGDRQAVRMNNGNYVDALCYDSTGALHKMRFTFQSPDSYLHPMIVKDMHTYNMQEPNQANLDYVAMWSWNHVGTYGEKRFMDAGRFNTPDVLGIRISDIEVPADSTTQTTASVNPKSSGIIEKSISVSSSYKNDRDVPQEYTSPSFTYTMSSTYTIAHASAFKTAYSTKVKLKFPLFGETENTVTFDYTGTTTETTATTETVAITVPSQKIMVPVGCSARVEQVLRTGQELGVIDLSTKVAKNVTSNGVIWKTDGTQQKVKGMYNFYDMMTANNPTPTESWIKLDPANKTVVLKDLATYKATKDNSVITRILTTCNGKVDSKDVNEIPSNF